LIDVLVISHACFTSINRNVYHLLVKDGYRLEMVVPESLRFPSGVREAQPAMPEDPPIHFLNLIGDNPRTYSFEGLDELLKEKKPSIVLLDNDPVSRLAIFAGEWCHKNEALLFCISCENLPLGILPSIRRRGLKSLPAIMLKRWMLSKTKNTVDGIFTINRDGQKIFQEEGYRWVRYMPLGFDPAYFFPDADNRLRIRNELGLKNTIIAYFGRLTTEKGIHILIRALAGLKNLPWELMMDAFDEFGSDYSQQVKKELEEADIMDRVVYISPSHFEIAAYMNAADLVVVPSVSVPNWKEQYGRVAAEAMACGKTVIASDSGSLPELLNSHGILFPEGNVEVLREILKKKIPAALNEEPNSRLIADYATKELSICKQKLVLKNGFETLKKQKTG
jgi:glycosyltransferase involved in cell wall biosynthesis